jgi:UDP:flavonoid glycosyltransferase YjiC (YdhE family)
VADWHRHPAKVEAALVDVLDDPGPARAATALAAAIAGEDGPGAAADAVEHRLAHPAGGATAAGAGG